MRRFVGLAVVLAWVVLTPVDPASAASSTTYHGVFGGEVEYVGCTPTPQTTLATGRWNVTIRGTQDAVVSVNIFTDGRHHVSFGGPVPLGTRTTQVFVVGPIQTLAGPLTMELSGSTFTYRIDDYNLFDVSCPGGSVTYVGSLR
jgi:hypothetical protein